jgi:hypothetical protein
MYDGLGHPLGLPFLAALPAIVGKVAAFLPQLANVASKVLPFLQGAGAMPQGQPAPMPAPDMMAPPSMQAPIQPPMQSSMPSAMQPFMQTPMQSIPQGMQPQLPLPMAPISPASFEPAGGPLAPAPREEVVVAPVRVQKPNGEMVVVPIRLRRRRRSRRGPFARLRPATLPRTLSRENSIAPELVEPPRTLQGWFGFNGWRGF